MPTDKAAAGATTPARAPDAEVVHICSDMIRIDTSNYGTSDGPGERLAAEHVATLLDEVGIASTIVESEPGRASLLARWGGSEGDPILIHAHLDVVPAAASDWQVDPFSGEVKDGYVWGRGAVDMKDFNAMVLSSVRDRMRTARIPNRPIVFAFTADEEAGGHKGADWLVDNYPDWFETCTDAVGEVGGFSTMVRDKRLYVIEAAEKGMAWTKLTARGSAGHGSMIHPDNSVTTLAEALARIGRHEWPIRLTPAMRTLLATIGDVVGVEPTSENALELIRELGPAARMLAAGIRNTVNPTMLSAGYKVNVVPSEATGHIDGRFLPGFEEEFFDTLRDLCGPEIAWDFVSHQGAWETPYDGPLVAAMTRCLLEEDPDALVAPYCMSGGTDAKHFRRLGMRSYGFAPLRLPPELDFTALFHGVDERVPVDALEFGARVFDRFLDEI